MSFLMALPSLIKMADQTRQQLGAAAGGAISSFGQAAGMRGLASDLRGLQPLIQQQTGQAQGFLSPFQQAGSAAISPYQQSLASMQDPTAFVHNIMQSYHQSPQAHFQIQQAIQAGNRAASASGMLGSGAEQAELAHRAQQFTSADQQQYLQNIMGVGNQYRSGLSGLIGMGEQAGGQMGQFQMQGLQGQEQALAQAAAAKAKGTQAQAGGFAGLAQMLI